MSCCTWPASSNRVFPNGFQTRACSAGDLTIATTRPNETVDLTFTGSPRTSIIAISRARHRKGDMVAIRLTLPVTTGIAIDFRDGSTSGTQLLPGDRFPSQLYTTDGVDVTGMIRFVYSGAAWKYLDASFPA